MEEHGKGYVISTKSYKPFKLVYSKRFERETDARSFERKLKKDRVEKERIIRRIENM